MLNGIIPEFGKHAFVIWASYGCAALITGGLVLNTLLKSRRHK